jgi:hypothetical protein
MDRSLIRRSVVPLFALLLLATGCQSGPRPAAEFVRQASYLHDAALSSTVVRHPEVDEYLAEVGKRVVAGATAANPSNTVDPTFAGMRFHLVASDIVNAFGTGGGHIYLYNGLLQRCDSEEELAAALAVQFAHALDLDHQRTGMRPDTRGGADRLSIDRVAYLYVTFPFSSRQFTEADRRAFDFYSRGGWDPAKFADVYITLRRKGLDLPPLAGPDGQARPTLTERGAMATGLRSSLPASSREWRQATVADPETFREIKTLAAQAAARQLTDQTIRGRLYLLAFPNTVLPSEQPDQVPAQLQLRKDVIPPTPVGPPIEPS